MNSQENRKIIDVTSHMPNEPMIYKDDRIKGNNGGAFNMSNFVTKDEFSQYEKRIDDKFTHLNDKIDSLPERMADKMNLAVATEINKLKDEMQKENKTNVRWFIGIAVSIVLGLLKLFGIF